MTLVIPWHCWPLRLRHRRRDRAAMVSTATSFSRRLCVAAVTMAFMVGIVVGILLPAYVPSSFLPPSSSGSADAPPYQASRTSDNNGTESTRPDTISRTDGRRAQQQPNGPYMLRARTLHGVLSWPIVDTSSPSFISTLSTSRPGSSNSSGVLGANRVQRQQTDGKKNLTSDSASSSSNNINGASLDAARQHFLVAMGEDIGKSKPDNQQPPKDSKRIDSKQWKLTEFLLGSRQATPSEVGTVQNGNEMPRTNSSDQAAHPLLSGSGRSLLPMLAMGKEYQVPRGQPKEGVTSQPNSAELVTAGWPQITRPFPLPSIAAAPKYVLQPWDYSDEGHRVFLSTLDQGENGMNSLQNQPSSISGKHAPIEWLPSESAPEHPAVLDAATSDNSTEFRAEFEMVKSLVEDGVYWSAQIESLLPKGFSKQAVLEWIDFASNSSVVKVLEGCGRMQNRLLIFGDGTKSCCRYRQNNDQIQGEIFSFYLAQLLGLSSLPPAALGLLHGHEWQWQSVRGQLNLAQWNEQKPVVMTKFVNGLVPAYIPRHFRGDGVQELRRLHPIVEDLRGLNSAELQELAQWSDLVIFDYLTANLDRVVNNMYNKQWNPDMMAAPAHNLAKVSNTGLLVFLDNESGLLHGYRLLDKYETYHRAMLDSLCIFRRSTARAVRQLHRSADIGPKLKRALYESQSYMAEWLPLLPEKSVKILRDRLSRVVQQISNCERTFRNNSSTENAGPSSAEQLKENYNTDNSLSKPSTDY